MNNDFKLLFVGAIISLISSVITFLAQEVYKQLSKNQGKVKIYRKIVYSKIISNQTWGFTNSNDDIIFLVPIWIEIHNTKNKNEIIRNFNLALYNNGKKVTMMNQLSDGIINGEKQYYGDEGVYSFLVSPERIERYSLHFMVKKKDLNKNFDEVRVSYYDTRDKLKEFKLLGIDKCWMVQKNKIDTDWNLMA